VTVDLPRDSVKPVLIAIVEWTNEGAKERSV
jgi:hypothetical protein